MALGEIDSVKFQISHELMYLRTYLYLDNLEVFQRIRSDILLQLEKVFVTTLNNLFKTFEASKLKLHSIVLG